jgi:hypothetical protein
MDVGRGVMAVWNDFESGHEAEFDAWYQRQHIPERLSQPGFREARRYVAQRGSPRYCAFYWLDDITALTTAQYLERLARPTRWTQRIMPWFRDMARSPCTVTLDRGCGLGGTMMWIAVPASTGITPAQRSALQREFNASCDCTGIARMQLWERDTRAAGHANPEAQLRATQDFITGWIVFIDGSSEVAVREAGRRVETAIMADATQIPLLVSPSYQLTWQVSAAEVPPPCSDEEAGVTWSV